MASREDYAWAAGFFDGEGHVRAHPSERKVIPSKLYTLRLQLGQKEEPLVLRVRDIFGGGSISFCHARPEIKSSEQYRWTCSHRDTFRAMSLMWPWLGERKKADFKRALAAVIESRRAVTYPDRICGASDCGKTFTPTDHRHAYTQSYCSQRCGGRSRRQRKAADDARTAASLFVP